MKSPRFVFQIVSGRDQKGGAFFVRKVELVSLYPFTKTAGIRVPVNGRSVLTFASFDSLASTERKAAAKVFSRLREYPAITAAQQVAGVGCSVKQTAATAKTAAVAA